MLSKKNPKIFTKNTENNTNGYLVPIYNKNESFLPNSIEPEQVYLTVVYPQEIKGPHLHFIRNGCFTCIKGNARFILKEGNEYKCFYSGENHNYTTVFVPKGIPAALQNISKKEEAFILNMPSPAWTSEMNDEHSADFSDFNFESF